MTKRSFPYSIRMPLAALLLAAAGSAHAVLLYMTTGGTGSNLYTIDTVTQAVTLVGATGLNRIAGIDFDANGNLYATDGGSAGPSTLYILDSSTGAVQSTQGAISGVSGMGSIAFDSSGVLWGAAWAAGRLVTLNAATGQVLTDIPMIGTGNAFVTGLDFDASGTLYGSRGNAGGHLEDLVTIDTLTGAQTPIGGATNVIADIVFGSDGVLYGGEAQTGNIFSINPATGTKTFLFSTQLNTSGLTELAVNGVPEPATLALLGVALAGLGFSRRRKLH